MIKRYSWRLKLDQLRRQLDQCWSLKRRHATVLMSIGGEDQDESQKSSRTRARGVRTEGPQRASASRLRQVIRHVVCRGKQDGPEGDH
jgi:hypothetical protein